jgi:hypothetical protein
MKRIVSTLLGLAVLAALGVVTTTSKHIVQPVYARSGCTDKTVKGNYGLTFSGFTVPGQNPKAKEVPFAGEGLFTFDGAGNVSGVYNGSQNGQVFTAVPYSATYIVNSDYTGTVIGAPGGNADGTFVIVSGGAEVFFTQTDPGGTWNADLKKQ